MQIRGVSPIGLGCEQSQVHNLHYPFWMIYVQTAPTSDNISTRAILEENGKSARGLDGVTCHIDDIIIEGDEDSSSPESHDVRLRALLMHIKQSGLMLNLDKCIFARTAVGYLGQIVDGLGLHKDPSKVKAIIEFPEPQEITALCRFLGMANQLMNFCNNLAELTQPLQDL